VGLKSNRHGNVDQVDKLRWNLSVKLSELKPYVNSAVDPDPAPVHPGPESEAWMVRSTETGWATLESHPGTCYRLRLRAKEVKRVIERPSRSVRPCWKLHHTLTYDGHRFLGSEDAE